MRRELRRLRAKLDALEAADEPDRPEPEDAPVRRMLGRLNAWFAPDEESRWRGSFGMGPAMRRLMWGAWQALRVLSWFEYQSTCSPPALIRMSADIHAADTEFMSVLRTALQGDGPVWSPWTPLTVHELKAAVVADYPGRPDKDLDPDRPEYDFQAKRWVRGTLGLWPARPVAHLVSDLPPWHHDFPPAETWPAEVAAALAASLSVPPAEVPPFDWVEVPHYLYHWPFPRDPNTRKPLPQAVAWMEDDPCAV